MSLQLLGTLHSCSIRQTLDGFSLGTLYGSHLWRSSCFLVIQDVTQFLLEENNSVHKGRSHVDSGRAMKAV